MTTRIYERMPFEVFVDDECVAQCSTRMDANSVMDKRIGGPFRELRLEESGIVKRRWTMNSTATADQRDNIHTLYAPHHPRQNNIWGE
jgi:hypothetical protein